MESSSTRSALDRRFLRLPEVLARVPVSRSRWYEGVKKGEFPAPIKLSANIRAWRAVDIEALIDRLSEAPNAE